MVDLFPDDTDDLDDHVASALGIMECLRILTAEAASLSMARTMDALRQALVACESEGLSAAGPGRTTRDGSPIH